MWLFQKPDNKNARIVMTVIATILIVAPFAGGNDNSQDSTPSDNGSLTVNVSAADWPADTTVPVHVEGTLSTGESYSKDIQCTPSESYPLDDAQAGSYTVSIDDSALQVDDKIYQVTEIPDTTKFAKTSDVCIQIAIRLDNEATKRLADQKAAEEAEQKAAEVRNTGQAKKEAL